MKPARGTLGGPGRTAEGLLGLKGLTKRYGALTVIDDLSLTLAENEILGVIGPNGAGKTTLFNLITGDVRSDRGHIRFDGADIARFAPAARCRAGIGRTYQIPRPFVDMSVYENLLVSAGFGAELSKSRAHEHCMTVLELTGLAPQANTTAGRLRLLDRKRLELARALASRPRLLLLDEIAGGLTDPEVHRLIETIRAIRGENISIIWIEHVVHALSLVVNRLVAIDGGRVVSEGDPDSVLASEAVQSVYMGVENNV